MPKVLVIGALIAFGVFQCVGQTSQKNDRPPLKRMSATDFSLFLHDLDHDLPNWQTRLSQYRSRLDTSLRWDALVDQKFSLVQTDIGTVRSEVAQLVKRETLTDDIWLNNGLQELMSELDTVTTLLSESEDMEQFSSPSLRTVSVIWSHTSADTNREVTQYRQQIFRHLLATSLTADIPCSRGVPKH